MDMSSSSSNSTVMAMMVPWLHFTGGDSLYFQSWRPTSHGAIAGACIGLVFLALFERWLAGIRGVMEERWKQRALAIASNQASAKSTTLSLSRQGTEGSTGVDSDKQTPLKVQTQPSTNSRIIAPFIPYHDYPRGVIHAAQALLMYLLMLAVMTFQAAYIVSIILGLGLGEILFGRLGRAQSH